MDASLDLSARVRDFVAQRLPSLACSRAAVLAVSGGADSMAMTALLCESGVVDPSRSVVGHFDHQLRGEVAGADDRAAVSSLCQRYSLALAEGSWDEPACGEASARRARYEFLSRICDQSGLDAIVTGHTADDQVETVLMHALRGAGLHGLSGMAPESTVPYPATAPPAMRAPRQLLRPLLALTRAETRAYCEANAIPFVDDPTNDDLTFLRNRIRREMLPALEREAPDIRRTLVRLAEASRCVGGLLDRLVGPAIHESADGQVTLSRPALRALPPDAAAHAYRIAVERLLGHAREFDRRHFSTMVAAASARTGSRFQLPHRVELTVDAGILILSVGPLMAFEVPAGFERSLPFTGTAGAWTIDIRPGPRPELNFRPRQFEALRLPEGAVLRAWRPGDRIELPDGRHQKLQDRYVDRKVPRRERQAAPVIARGSSVIWSPLLPVWGAPAGSPPRASWLVTSIRRQPSSEADSLDVDAT